MDFFKMGEGRLLQALVCRVSWDGHSGRNTVRRLVSAWVCTKSEKMCTGVEWLT